MAVERVQQQQQQQPLPMTGRSPKGVAFTVPPTRDMFHVLRTPSCWGPSELFTLLCSAQILISALFVRRIPYPFYVLQFLFWRLMYNLGLGLLLHVQSRDRTITRWLVSRDGSTHALLRWAVTKSLPQRSYDWSSLPPCFNAWIVFRAVATLILTNDGLSYFVLIVASLTGPPATLPGKLRFALLNAPLAALLALFGTWAKASAHAVLSDFAWFWGDFFFTIDANLSFDGVFNLVPHPMYTAGYAAYYAAALVTRSHTLFQISLFAHVSQLLFLALVEHPHICKTYSTDDPTPSSASHPGIVDSTPTHVPASANVERQASFARDFEDAAPSPLFRAALTAVVAVVTLVLAFARPPAFLLVAAVLAVHAGHWIVLAHQLAPASSSLSSPSRLVALVALRHAGLVSSAARHALFAMCAWRFMPSLIATTPAGRSAGLFGCVMLGLCAQGWRTALADVGELCAASAEHLLSIDATDKGEPAKERTTSEPGSAGATTRFLSRPLLVVPYALYYAAAFAARSSVVAGVAAVAHAMHLLFARHMYRSVAVHPPWAPAPTVLERTLRRLPGVSVVCAGVVAGADRGFVAGAEIFATARVRFERGQADVAKQGQRAARAVESSLVEMGRRATASAPDGHTCVNELRRRGVDVVGVDAMSEH